MEKASDKIDPAEAVLIFTRVEADNIDTLMSDPELVLATVEDMGFDQEDMLATLTAQGGDPGVLYYMMEGRWSGEETNFSFEKLWGELKQKFVSDDVSLATLKMIEIEGRNSQIYNEYGPVRVLTVDQVKHAQAVLETMVLTVNDDDKYDTDSQSLGDLFDALKIFFGFASKEGDFVLVSLV